MLARSRLNESSLTHPVCPMQSLGSRPNDYAGVVSHEIDPILAMASAGDGKAEALATA